MSVPTERELEILEVLWECGEATVRQVHESLRQHSVPIVQNTVQAFLRTMEEKKLVTHRVEGRSFVYRPLIRKQSTRSVIMSGVLRSVFGGAMDQLVRSAFDARAPSQEELDELESLIAEARKRTGSVQSRRKTKKRKGGGK